MKNLTSITSKFWPVGRFFSKSEWTHWSPLLWDSTRQYRWYYSIYCKIYIKLNKHKINENIF